MKENFDMERLDTIKSALRELDFSNFPESVIHLGSSGVYLSITKTDPKIYGLNPEGNVVAMPYPNTPDLVV